MFIAKYLDKKEGEARIVDQRQVVREKLSLWFEQRPTVDDLTERGILGRSLRFNVARDSLERFFLSRQQQKEEEAYRIPAGDFQYSSRALELLRGVTISEASVEAKKPCKDSSTDVIANKLVDLQSELGAAEERVEELAAEWRQAAEDCDQRMRTNPLKEVAAKTSGVLQLLSEHRNSTGSALAELNADLLDLQKCLSKRSVLDRINTLHEKTDAVREAVFAWGDTDALPLDALEEIPLLCAGLPSRCQLLGAKRLKFLISPVRDALTIALHSELKDTGRWPLTEQANTTKAPATLGDRVIRLCVNLTRTQRVDQERMTLHKGKSGKNNLGASSSTGMSELWMFGVLASSLASRFRHHFCRRESKTCKMDKPEWAFKYLLDLAKDHASLIEEWAESALATKEGLNSQQLAAIDGVDFFAGLMLQMASEARFFVRGRMPALARPESRPLFLHTLLHLVTLQLQMGELCQAAAEVVFADFDENYVITIAEDPNAASASASKSAGGASLFGHLKKVQTDEKTFTGKDLADDMLTKLMDEAEGKEDPKSRNEIGMLDLWIEADASFIKDKIEASAASGAAWRTRPLILDDGLAEATSQAEVAELGRIMTNLMEKSGERLECLTAEPARQSFGKRVLQEGLRSCLGVFRDRWNSAEDVLKETEQTCLLIETLDEVCSFLDSFPLGPYITEAADEAIELRLGMVEKLVRCLVDTVQLASKRLRLEPGLVSSVLGPPLYSISRRLRPSNFMTIVQKCATMVADLLSVHLLRHVVSFLDVQELNTFAMNCHDLTAVLEPYLGAEHLEILLPLQERCGLLVIPEGQATEAIEKLRHIAKCAPNDFLSEDFDGNDEGFLRRKQQEVLTDLGAQVIPLSDAVTVLGKRPEFFGKLQDLEEKHAINLGGVAMAGMAAAQEMLPELAKLQTGVETLQQLQSVLPVSSLAGISKGLVGASGAALQSGVSGVGGLVGGLQDVSSGALRTGLGISSHLVGAAPGGVENLRRSLKGASVAASLAGDGLKGSLSVARGAAGVLRSTLQKG